VQVKERGTDIRVQVVLPTAPAVSELLGHALQAVLPTPAPLLPTVLMGHAGHRPTSLCVSGNEPALPCTGTTHLRMHRPCPC
jgi:hypothetical protein